MDSSTLMLPAGSQINALVSLWDAIVDWICDDEGDAADAASSYDTSPVTRAPDSGMTNASLPAIARDTETAYGPWYSIPEMIELRFGVIQGMASETKPPAPAVGDYGSEVGNKDVPEQNCRQRSIPYEAIEYRYGTEARNSMYLPICGSQ